MREGLPVDSILKLPEGKMMRSRELRWGLIIGAANLVWLYGGFWLGLHSRGLEMIYGLSIGAIIISTIGYVLAMRFIFRAEPDLAFLEGLRSGILISGVVAVVAVATQAGYLLWINPGWTASMVQEVEAFYLNSGLSPEEAGELARGAEKTFGFRANLIQAALGALTVGVLTTAIITFYLRRRIHA